MMWEKHGPAAGMLAALICGSTAAEGTRVVINVPEAGIYLGTQVIAKVTQGQEFISLEKRGAWYSVAVMVQGQRKVGWIKEADVKVADTPKVEGPPATLPKGMIQKDGQFLWEKDGAVMVRVPAGEFVNGDRAAFLMGRCKRVHLDEFYIDAYEVTNAQYLKFVEETGRAKPQFMEEPKTKDPKQPVVAVTYEDAVAYATWAGKWLPSSEEWDKAARGTEGFAYPWGEAVPTPTHAAFGFNPAEDGPLPVGSREKDRSPFGAFDLAGNVREWTSTPGGPSRHIVRGGAWAMAADNLRLRLSFNSPDDKTDGLQGFRCVVSSR